MWRRCARVFHAPALGVTSSVLSALLALGIVPLLAAGCVSSPPDPPAAERFSPDDEPELVAVVEDAAARWSRAACVPIEVGPGGVPVRLVDRLPRGDGTESLGATTADLSLVQIHVRGRYAWGRTVLHELGHALGGGHVDTMGALSYHKGYEAVIDGASLASVCEKLACECFNPERE